jgi:hypothetical protein
VTFAEALDYLNRGGVLAMALLYIAGFYREWHKTGADYRKLEARCGTLEEAAWRNLRLAEDLVALIKELDPPRAEQAQRDARRGAPIDGTD